MNNFQIYNHKKNIKSQSFYTACFNVPCQNTDDL